MRCESYKTYAQRTNGNESACCSIQTITRGASSMATKPTSNDQAAGGSASTAPGSIFVTDVCQGEPYLDALPVTPELLKRWLPTPTPSLKGQLRLQGEPIFKASSTSAISTSR